MPRIEHTPLFLGCRGEQHQPGGWDSAKLQLYIGKRPYDANWVWEDADAILGTDLNAPLADLFRGNELLGLPPPITTKVGKLMSSETSTISVQAFEDESCGYNYNWRFMWARFRAAEVANELVKGYYLSQQDKDGDKELRFC